MRRGWPVRRPVVVMSMTPPCVSAARMRSSNTLLQVLLHRFLELRQLREATRRQLRVDELVVDLQLEHAPLARDERQALRPLGKRRQQLLRRPRGACCVVSRHAVLQGYL